MRNDLAFHGLVLRVRPAHVGCQFKRRLFEEAVGLVMVNEKTLYLQSQVAISGTSLLKKRSPLFEVQL